MKILILGFAKLAYMPYMNIHIDTLKKHNHELHLVYWDRDGKPDIPAPKGVICHKFKLLQKDEVPGLRKIGNFSKYRGFVKKLLKSQSFDRIIVLSTIPAVLLSDILLIKYKNRYIFDYRDVTFEQLPVYRGIVGLFVKNSAKTLVSSDAFRKFLPNSNNVLTSHNILTDAVEKRDIRSLLPRDQNPIRIRYWGLIRHPNINRFIIDALANDRRFELHYHGRMEDVALGLQQYCVEKEIKNVFFHGSYLPQDRYAFIKETDILHNMYENDFRTQPAMGNKFYDGVLHYIPQLCTKGSYMGRVVLKNGLGLAVDLETQAVADDFFSYYNSIDWKSFEISADQCLENIISEDNLCRDAILKGI